MLYESGKAHSGEEWNGKFHHNQNRGYGTEFIVGGEIVDKNIGEPREIMTPREEDSEDRHSQESPFHRRFHQEESEDGKHQYESADIYGAIGHGLIAEILRELIDKLQLLGRQILESIDVDISHGEELILSSHRFDGCPTLHVREKKCECFIHAITPRGDVATLHTSGVVATRSGKFSGTTTHCFFGIFVGIIEA